jgi:superoxide dismutase, Fe-Mn family
MIVPYIKKNYSGMLEVYMPFELPPLPYEYNALEPHIDETTLHLHHDKHHKAYVDGLNNAEAKLAEAREKGDFALIKHWARELAFHGSGHILHTLYWNKMAPTGKGGGGKPDGALLRQLEKDFGSYELFAKQFSAAAVAVEGSGWAILVYSPLAKKLEILTAEKHQDLTQWGAIPLLTVDVWEHAYYVKYQNRRADYLAAWWNVVNWPEVARRFGELDK